MTTIVSDKVYSSLILFEWKLLREFYAVLGIYYRLPRLKIKYTVCVIGKNIKKSIWLFYSVFNSPAMMLIDRYSLLTGEVCLILVKPFLFSRQEKWLF